MWYLYMNLSTLKAAELDAPRAEPIYAGKDSSDWEDTELRGLFLFYLNKKSTCKSRLCYIRYMK